MTVARDKSGSEILPYSWLVGSSGAPTPARRPPVVNRTKRVEMRRSETGGKAMGHAVGNEGVRVLPLVVVAASRYPAVNMAREPQHRRRC